MKLTVLLGALIALPALGTDFFVPSLPALAQAFEIDAAGAQLAITTYFAGIAAGQLAWGPLSDRYGRKPVLLVGLGTMLAASLAALVAESLVALSVARLAQGLGMSAGAVMGRSVVRDLYAHEEAARMLAAMMIVFSVVPVSAPLAGVGLARLARDLRRHGAHRGGARRVGGARAGRVGAAGAPLGASAGDRAHLRAHPGRAPPTRRAPPR